MYFTFFKQTGLFHASRENHHQTSSYNFSALGRGRQGCLATHDSLLPRVTLIPGGNAEQSSGPLGLQERRVPGVFLLLMQHVQDGETRASPTDSSDPSPPHPRPKLLAPGSDLRIAQRGPGWKSTAPWRRTARWFSSLFPFQLLYARGELASLAPQRKPRLAPASGITYRAGEGLLGDPELCKISLPPPHLS